MKLPDDDPRLYRRPHNELDDDFANDVQDTLVTLAASRERSLLELLGVMELVKSRLLNITNDK